MDDWIDRNFRLVRVKPLASLSLSYHDAFSFLCFQMVPWVIGGFGVYLICKKTHMVSTWLGKFNSEGAGPPVCICTLVIIIIIIANTFFHSFFIPLLSVSLVFSFSFVLVHSSQFGSKQSQTLWTSRHLFGGWFGGVAHSSRSLATSEKAPPTQQQW